MKKLKIEKFFNESTTMSVITHGLRLQKDLNSALIDYNLNLNQALILLAIFFESTKSVRSTELIPLIPTTKSNISHCTSSLEAQKLITRKSIDGDLRGFEFHLSHKGHKLCLNLVKFFDDIENKCDQKFSASQRKELIEMVRKV